MQTGLRGHHKTRKGARALEPGHRRCYVYEVNQTNPFCFCWDGCWVIQVKRQAGELESPCREGCTELPRCGRCKVSEFSRTPQRLRLRMKQGWTNSTYYFSSEIKYFSLQVGDKDGPIEKPGWWQLYLPPERDLLWQNICTFFILFSLRNSAKD